MDKKSWNINCEKCFLTKKIKKEFQIKKIVGKSEICFLKKISLSTTRAWGHIIVFIMLSPLLNVCATMARMQRRDPMPY